MKYRRGFTLAEAIITMGLIGVLATILIPILQNTMPGKDKVMVRKCYYTVKKNAYQMVADLMDNYGGSFYFSGYTDVNFKKDFKSLLNTADSITPSANDYFAQTVDGVDWFMKKDSSWGDAAGMHVYFDINGSKNSPNCTQYSSVPTLTGVTYKKCGNNVLPDTYEILINGNGKLNIHNSNQTYLNSILSDTSNIKRE